MSKKRGREREGRTLCQVSDAGCIPLGDITVERRGIFKRYTKELKKQVGKQEDKKSYRKRKKVEKRTILLIKESFYQYKIEMSEKKRKREGRTV